MPGLGPAAWAGILVVIQSFEHQQCVGCNVKRWKYKEVKQHLTISMAQTGWGRRTGKQYSLESVTIKVYILDYLSFIHRVLKVGWNLCHFEMGLRNEQ